MKVAAVFVLVANLVAVSAFTVVVPSSMLSTSTTLFSEPPKSEEQDEGGLDLDLEEMFTMFDAAAKEEKFDDAIKKVKKETKK